MSVVNPLSIKRFGQMRMQRAKTDKKDAQLIAAYAQMEKPAAWQPQEQYVGELKQTMTVREQLQKQHTATNNQQQALLLSAHQNKKAQQVLSKQLEQLKQDIEELEKETGALVKRALPRQL